MGEPPLRGRRLSGAVPLALLLPDRGRENAAEELGFGPARPCCGRYQLAELARQLLSFSSRSEKRLRAPPAAARGISAPRPYRSSLPVC